MNILFLNSSFWGWVIVCVGCNRYLLLIRVLKLLVGISVNLLFFFKYGYLEKYIFL